MVKSQAPKNEKKPRSWLYMEFLHKDLFDVRLQLDALYEITREVPRNREEPKKKIGQN